MHMQAVVLFIGSCLLLITGSFGESVTDNIPTPNAPVNFENGRIFFGDPCTNPIYQFLGITDAKCSFQCYLQAGLQNGGFCQNNACQCNEAVTAAP